MASNSDSVNSFYTGDEGLNVETSYDTGNLWDFSFATVLEGGSIETLNTHDDTSVCVAGGNVNNFSAYHYSCVFLSSGYINTLNANEGSHVMITGGSISNHLNVATGGSMEISGGEINEIQAKTGFTSVNISGGKVNNLYSGDNEVNISGGQINNVEADGKVNISGGYMTSLSGQSFVEMSGGSVSYLDTGGGISSGVNLIDGEIGTLTSTGSSRTIISGGSIDYFYINLWNDPTHHVPEGYATISGGNIELLSILGDSNVLFFGYDYVLGEGLSLNNSLLIGTGILSGKWADGSSWITEVSYNEATSVIKLNTVIPEPASLLLLGLGGLLIRHRKKG
jgi:hypothetical protein